MKADGRKVRIDANRSARYRVIQNNCSADIAAFVSGVACDCVFVAFKKLIVDGDFQVVAVEEDEGEGERVRGHRDHEFRQRRFIRNRDMRIGHGGEGALWPYARNAPLCYDVVAAKSGV